jgi:hypothetical protein
MPPEVGNPPATHFFQTHPNAIHMSDNEMIVAIVSTAISCITLVTLVRVWVNRGRSNPTPGPQLEPLMDRLLRIEQTLDSVAVEVERISEGQRFTTRLLADREKTPATYDQGAGRS